jgi:hypothetical protein
VIAETLIDVPDHNGKLASAFARISDQYVGFQLVEMPPTWKEEKPDSFTFVIFEEELTREQLHLFFEVSEKLGLTNPRPISRRLLELASLFHPLFYSSFKLRRGQARAEGELAAFTERLSPYRLKLATGSGFDCSSELFYLQSLLFLAGCTLSAAIIQNRFSTGTIESKLNRLWQAAQYAKRFNYSKFNALDMEKFVVECAAADDNCSVAQLIEIKKAYGRALVSLSDSVSIELQTVKQEDLSLSDKIRFGFVPDFRQMLGENLQCILVYGSSVTSINFHDFDLVVVVKDGAKALRRLTGMNPSYRGKEINLSIYDSEDVISFQSMSGDNLNHNARCIFGETEIPIKAPSPLMLRNFSFAFIRLRQLLGMAGFLARQKLHQGLADPKNLYEYFVKIPMHIMKGVRSVAHEPISKEYINAFTAKELGYDLNEQLSLLKASRFTEAIANAYLATQGVITHLNDCYGVFEKSCPTSAGLADSHST